MSEEEPVFRVDINEQTYDLRREDLTVYTFLGRAAVFNHVFSTYQHEGQTKGAWTFAYEELHGPLSRFAEENNSLMILNADTPSPRDVEVYVRKQTRDLRGTEGVPEEWTHGEA